MEDVQKAVNQNDVHEELMKLVHWGLPPEPSPINCLYLFIFHRDMGSHLLRFSKRECKICPQADSCIWLFFFFFGGKFGESYFFKDEL